LVAIESLGWVIDNFTERSKDERYLAKLQKIINAIESNKDIIATSPHIMAIAVKR
jgi:hypothetical protein